MIAQEKTSFNVLLADDNKVARYLFESALKSIAGGHKLKTVPDGAGLMVYLTKNSNPLPDVIFLELNMPRKSGSECLSEIKNNKKLSHLPVIIFTSALKAEDADQLYNNGAHYYLCKCDFDDLVKHLQVVLGLLAANSFQPLRANFILNPPEKESSSVDL